MYQVNNAAVSGIELEAQFLKEFNNKVNKPNTTNFTQLIGNILWNNRSNIHGLLWYIHFAFSRIVIKNYTNKITKNYRCVLIIWKWFISSLLQNVQLIWFNLSKREKKIIRKLLYNIVVWSIAKRFQFVPNLFKPYLNEGEDM